MKEKKSKKKKEKHNIEESVENSTNVVLDMNGTDIDSVKKKKKKKKQQEAEMPVDTGNDVGDMHENSNHRSEEKVVKKKKKKKLEKTDTGETVNYPEETVISVAEENTEKKKKKKKHRDQKEDKIVSHAPMEMENEFEEKSVKRKKKKKDKMRTKNDDVSLCSPKKKTHKHKDVEQDAVNSADVNTSGVTEETVEMKEIRKKRRKKQVIEDEHNADDSTSGDVTEIPVKKKKLTHKEETNNQSQHSYNCVPFSYHGNSTSTNGQHVVHGEKMTGDGDSKVTDVGQWSTASLGSDDRKQKFMRLMGGFKKGGESGNSKFSAGKKFGNFALNLNQEEDLNKNLEKQYDQALALKLGQEKGVGLGFQPPPGAGKKFYIDKYATKSIKFDD